MTTREIGAHVGCGGVVSYTFTGSQGFRHCAKCGADGRYGRPTPEVERAAAVRPRVASLADLKRPGT